MLTSVFYFSVNFLNLSRLEQLDGEDSWRLGFEGPGLRGRNGGGDNGSGGSVGQRCGDRGHLRVRNRRMGPTLRGVRHALQGAEESGAGMGSDAGTKRVSVKTSIALIERRVR